MQVLRKFALPIGCAFVFSGALATPSASGDEKRVCLRMYKQQEISEAARRNWRESKGFMPAADCDGEYLEHIPVSHSETFGWPKKGPSFQFWRHQSGYYLKIWVSLEFKFVDTKPKDEEKRMVRTTDPLVLTFDDGTRFETYPTADLVWGSSGNSMCGYYEMTDELLIAFESKALTTFRMYLTTLGPVRWADDITSTEEGRAYIEYDKFGPDIRRHMQGAASCTLKAAKSDSE